VHDGAEHADDGAVERGGEEAPVVPGRDAGVITEHAAGGGDWSDAAARHTLRIRLKRLRYVCEFFTDCVKRKRVRRYLEHLEGLQDLLGELNDLATARRVIGDLDAAGAGVQSAFIRGWISAREDALIASLDEAWRALGKQTRPA